VGIDLFMTWRSGLLVSHHPSIAPTLAGVQRLVAGDGRVRPLRHRRILNSEWFTKARRTRIVALQP
jgi:hypothetical protein